MKNINQIEESLATNKFELAIVATKLLVPVAFLGVLFHLFSTL